MCYCILKKIEPTSILIDLLKIPFDGIFQFFYLPIIFLKELYIFSLYPKIDFCIWWNKALVCWTISYIYQTHH